MPERRRGRGGFRTLGTIRSFVSLLREVSLDEVKDDALLAPLLAVVAPTEGEARRVAAVLVGPDHAGSVTARTFTDPLSDLSRYDAVVAFDPEREPLADDLRRAVGNGPVEPVVIPFPSRNPGDVRAAEETRARIVGQLPNRATGFGRAFPAFRRAAAAAVINETARANAQFAFVSNVPAVIPLVGSLIAAGADFLVLTKNQVIMIFKVAAIHGRDLDDRMGIARELIPVVGAGLAWRTAAREAASFLPLAAGTIPKVVIAYAGTQVAGRAADFYYRMGTKPSRNQITEFYRQAADAVRSLPLPLPGVKEERSDGADEPRGMQGTPDGNTPPVLSQSAEGEQRP